MNININAFICHHYQKEIETIIQQEKLINLEIIDYLPVCIRPNSIAAVNKKISNKENACLIADTCILNQTHYEGNSTDAINLNSHLGNCLQMLVGKELLEFYAADGGYLVSPGWLSGWQQNLNEWGFDQSTARQFFSEFAKRIVLLDSGTYAGISQNLSDFANYLNLPYQTIPVGLDHIRLVVLNKISDAKNRKEIEQLSSQTKLANQQVADYALAFDLVTNLTRMMNESEAMREIDNTFKMLFSPKETAYISLYKGKINNNITQYVSEEKKVDLLNWVNNSNEEYYINETKNSFYIRISHQSQTLGAAEISELSFPQYIDKYLNMALSIAPLFGLAISKARSYQQLEEDEVLLQKLASTDSLTGLYNRRYFLTALDTEFARSKRYHSPLSAIMLDIDHFKLVNDTYGHAIGDKVLSELANIIAGELRKSDIAARLGGDEFIILLPETNQDNSLVFSNRLRKNIEKTFASYDSGPVSITTSIGVSEINIDCNSPEDIMHHCDQALYNAKSKGRNLVLAWEKNPIS